MISDPIQLQRDLIHALRRLANALEARPPITHQPQPATVAFTPEAPAWATPERITVLRALYPTDATEMSIRKEMQKHPGPPLPPWRDIGSFAIRQLCLIRGARSFHMVTPQ